MVAGLPALSRLSRRDSVVPLSLPACEWHDSRIERFGDEMPGVERVSDLAFWCGAGDRDRTGTTSLEGRHGKGSGAFERAAHVRLDPAGHCMARRIGHTTGTEHRLSSDLGAAASTEVRCTDGWTSMFVHGRLPMLVHLCAVLGRCLNRDLAAGTVHTIPPRKRRSSVARFAGSMGILVLEIGSLKISTLRPRGSCCRAVTREARSRSGL